MHYHTKHSEMQSRMYTHTHTRTLNATRKKNSYHISKIVRCGEGVGVKEVGQLP